MTTALEPAWLRHARSLIRTREAAGAANSATIMGWAKKLGTKVLGMVYNADSVPWCGLFVATCLAEDGIPAAPIAVRAKAWASWGANLAAERLAPGTVLVFDRAGGGTSASTSARISPAITSSAATKAIVSASCVWRSRGVSRGAGRSDVRLSGSPG
jgi:hypothetical protein